ncbi:MAG: nucleotidyltransferase family protein [Thermotogaceae bacterium]|nr:nucleotidyltransferase family protein [Thermotogaceae bacterium]
MRQELGAFILSAGISRRFPMNKCLVKIEEKPLLQWSIDLVKSLPVAFRALIVNPQWESIKNSFDANGFEIVVNKDYLEGMSSSLRLCVQQAVHRSLSAVLIFHGDMPFISRASAMAVLNEFSKSEEPVASAFYNGVKGFPTLIDRTLFSRVMKLTQDRGLREIFLKDPSVLRKIEVDDPGVVFDVDTITDLKRALEWGKRVW